MMEILISFIFLSFLEIILGIDNLIFISLIVDKIKKEYQSMARIIGLSLSLIFRLLLLFFISFLLKLTIPLFSIFSTELSTKDLILIAGGIFLIYKASSSIYNEVESIEKPHSVGKNINFWYAIAQIIIIDFVFSLDSLITAVGMTNHMFVIAGAIISSIIFMLIFSSKINNVIKKYNSLKILALSFILMIGVLLIADGFHNKVSKGYIYFAMGFSLAVEFINIILHSKKSKN